MDIKVLSSWIEQINTQSLYCEFETEDDSLRAERTMTLSRISRRTKEENLELYDNLDWLITQSKGGSVASKTIIIYAFYPFLLKHAMLYYKNFCMAYRERILLEDIIQNAFEKILDVIDTYNSDVASFTHCTNILLKLHIKSYIKKEVRYIQRTPILVTGQNTLDFLYKHNNSIFNQLISEEILLQIKNALRKYTARARSKTSKSVCNEFFFGNKSCQQVATDCGVSYHAVYEIIHRAKTIIADILKHNKNCGYKATLESTNIWTLKRKKRDYLSTHLYKAICKGCGYQWVYSSKSADKCSRCSSINWEVNKEYVKLFS